MFMNKLEKVTCIITVQIISLEICPLDGRLSFRNGIFLLGMNLSDLKITKKYTDVFKNKRHKTAFVPLFSLCDFFPFRSLMVVVIYELHEQMIQVFVDEITSSISQAILFTESFSQKLRNENISQA